MTLTEFQVERTILGNAPPVFVACRGEQGELSRRRRQFKVATMRTIGHVPNFDGLCAYDFAMLAGGKGFFKKYQERTKELRRSLQNHLGKNPCDDADRALLCLDVDELRTQSTIMSSLGLREAKKKIPDVHLLEIMDLHLFIFLGSGQSGPRIS